MSSEDLLFRVECYVGLRHALGYVVRSEEKLLKDFVRFIGAQAIAGPIRAQTALDWACTFSPYMGHTKPACTYWYLTALPELLSAAGDCFQKFANQGADQ